jgi:hypothetical protein
MVIAEIGAPLTIVVLIVVAAGLVALGFAWGRFIALVVLGAVMTAALVICDVLYFGFGVNLIGYCGEPKCDPGPIPSVIAVPFLIFPLFFVAIGVRVRQDWRKPQIPE